MNAKFVYFDVGGVVVLDFSGNDKWKQFRRSIGIRPGKDAEFEEFWNRYEPEVNAGRDVETLLPLIGRQFGLKFPQNYSLLIDGFVNRFEVNRSVWPAIDRIRKQCRIGLLTNMYPNMLEAIRERGLLPKIDWDVVIDSSVEGVIKPDQQIFRLAEERSGFGGKEIAFVENSKKHIEAAKAMGWQTFLYDSAAPEESSARLSESFQ
jgi:FMN phosphatase YigB (HAD superfamily)